MGSNRCTPRGSTSDRTRPLARICPGPACEHRRAATTTAEPKYPPPSLVSGSPVLSPIRTDNARSGDCRSLNEATTCCMATAAFTASAALSNAQKRPSPVKSTSRPLWTAVDSRRRSKSARRTC